MRLFWSLFFSLYASLCTAESLRLAVTTSFQNSGLADVLLPLIANDTGLEVELLVVGTGQALRLGRAGDVDAILVHSTAAEEAFVAQGFGPYRLDVMYNDFVIVGPAQDPADVMAAQNVMQALANIANAQTTFVSRGDDSGTHRKELSLWAMAGLDAETFQTWYKPVGAGMGASLNTAVGLDAYILTDRASWLNFNNKGGLAVVYQGDPALFNQYGFLPISAERHPHVKAEAVANNIFQQDTAHS